MAEKLYYGLESGNVFVNDVDPNRLGISPSAWIASNRLLIAEAQWSVRSPKAAELAYLILYDALGDSKQARALHQRFKHRLMPTLTPGKAWQRTHAEVLAIVDELRANDALIEQQRRLVDAERPPAEHDGGRGVAGDRITWETDLRGNRTRERGE